MQKEADKNFYVVLIRFFDPENNLFHPSYEPPRKQKIQKKEDAAETQKVMELYSKALKGMPTLHGSSGKKSRMNLFQSLGNQKPLLSQTERLQSELHQKQKKLNGLLNQPNSNGDNQIQISNQMEDASNFAQDNKENVQQIPNVIGNLHEEQESIDVMEKLNNIETLCIDNEPDLRHGDSLMNDTEQK